MWIRFINRQDWKPNEHDGVCKLHFDSIYIVHGEERTLLNRRLNPVPTIYSDKLKQDLLKKPSLLPTATTSRKPPTQRNTSLPDEMHSFNESDNIDNYEMLNESCAPIGFLFQRCPDLVLYYRFF